MDDVPALDPVVHQPTRLRLLAALYKNRQASFRALRDGLALTDGNLASHAAKLEAAGYVEARRVLAGLSFEVRYRITPAGSDAFRAYVAALRAFVEATDATDAGGPLGDTLPGAPGDARSAARERVRPATE